MEEIFRVEKANEMGEIQVSNKRSSKIFGNKKQKKKV